jgi:hypothetical protein
VSALAPAAAGQARGASSVVTAMTIAASAARVWDGLMFYEQIPGRPPLALRLLLPSPRGTRGPRSAVGDETRCLYDRGHLLKRVTGIDPRRHYGFDVVEQDVAIGTGIRLTGGGYTLVELPDGSTRLELETRYLSPARPRWLCRPIEAAVCHAFHRHILRGMRRDVETRGDN